MVAELVQVAVAVIVDDRGRVLLTRRAADAHQGGLWEFPGGKLEPGEDVSDALCRECREELGIEIEGHRPLIALDHHYDDLSVRLHVQWVSAYAGTPSGLEGQPLAWVEPGALDDYPLPAADRPIVNAIRLPERYLITPPEVYEDGPAFIRALQSALDSGVRLVQFRVPGLEGAARQALATEALARVHDNAGQLLVNADIDLARRIGADGVHLTAAQLHRLDARPGGFAWVAGSCHDRADLQRAAALGLDFVVVSPVLRTTSHPDATPLGWAGLQGLLERANLPAFALGGVDASHLPQAWRAGAQGIAAIRGLWGART